MHVNVCLPLLLLGLSDVERRERREKGEERKGEEEKRRRGRAE